MTDLQPAAATDHYIEANGVKLHYLDYGTPGKRPMLCLHGGAAHAHWFDYVASGFTSDYHAYSLDARGHGDSGWADPATYNWKTFAADIDAVATRLDLHDFVLIGHSMGGMMSLNYAATHPGRLGALIIVDTVMLMPLERMKSMNEFGKRPAKPYGTQEELISRYRLEASNKNLTRPEVLRRMAVHSGIRGDDGKWRHKADRGVYASFNRVDGVPLWKNVKVPALTIRAEGSSRFNPAALAEIHANAPQVQVAEVPATDHHITLDNPEGFVKVVREFLRR